MSKKRTFSKSVFIRGTSMEARARYAEKSSRNYVFESLAEADRLDRKPALNYDEISHCAVCRIQCEPHPYSRDYFDKIHRYIREYAPERKAEYVNYIREAFAPNLAKAIKFDVKELRRVLKEKTQRSKM